MCNCPIETAFDDNEFIEFREVIEDGKNLLIKITFCPICELENERFAGYDDPPPIEEGIEQWREERIARDTDYCSAGESCYE